MPLHVSRPATLHASPTMIPDRTGSRADSLLRMQKEIGSDLPQVKAAPPRRTQVLIKSDEGKIINQMEASLGASTRVSAGAHHRHKDTITSGGILSGRIPETTGGPFATLETADAKILK
mmetsp:Transcript_39817/g.52119  ORF Transcript_39817/g.52119 Transcript_39817/m.52119 type:complete len:119 (+) Transcript_39817:2481-2837(+)